MVDATTRLLGIIGDPVEHSLSPQLHNYLLNKLNLNFRYLAFRVSPQNLPQAVAGLKALEVAGFNVTVPHKQAVLPLLDELSPEAQTLGAVNTVVYRDGKLSGHNTDWIGFLQPLDQRGVDLSGRRVVILGAGGAAWGVAFALLKRDIAHLTVINRTPSKAEDLVMHVKHNLGFDHVESMALEAGLIRNALQQAHLLVNATAVGLWPEIDRTPLDSDVLHSDLIVYDLVYNPLETALLKAAKRAGAQPVDGLGMLIAQGVAAFELWTGASVSKTHLLELRQLLFSDQNGGP